jgi:hypothetical protein
MSRRDLIDDVVSNCEGVVRDKLYREAGQRMRWPNPNPEDELDEAWQDYQAAYARHVFGGDAQLSPTGLREDTSDQLAQAWERVVFATMIEQEGAR